MEIIYSRILCIGSYLYKKDFFIFDYVCVSVYGYVPMNIGLEHLHSKRMLQIPARKFSCKFLFLHFFVFISEG